VRLHLLNPTGGPYESRNVVAEIKGRERPDEIVVLGAHLDSWDLGTGAEDNGANSVMVIEAARAIHALGQRPRRTIRFVLFTGEEQGMFGSAGYVQRHKAEIDRHNAVVIFDISSGRTTGFFLKWTGRFAAAAKSRAGEPGRRAVPAAVSCRARYGGSGEHARATRE
jgi:Zn-dependent M28 family amino/carboxypeptidase